MSHKKQNKKDDICFDYSVKHLVVLKTVRGERVKVIPMSTKDKEKNSTLENIPMQQNCDPKDNRESFFIPHVRNVKNNPEKLSPRSSFYLTKKDIKQSDDIYSTHRNNVRAERKRNKHKKRS